MMCTKVCCVHFDIIVRMKDRLIFYYFGIVYDTRAIQETILYTIVGTFAARLSLFVCVCNVNKVYCWRCFQIEFCHITHSCIRSVKTISGRTSCGWYCSLIKNHHLIFTRFLFEMIRAIELLKTSDSKNGSQVSGHPERFLWLLWRNFPLENRFFNNSNSSRNADLNEMYRLKCRNGSKFIVVNDRSR